ncbi:MAG: YggS family pyridoxal phosphate-dependent enzyme [candidate division WOR-3 bacterium]|nr:MAG: YggS family pyridoxal phosphate-dependent enzyme [candidate division WOR-3 bacterium]
MIPNQWADRGLGPLATDTDAVSTASSLRQVPLPAGRRLDWPVAASIIRPLSSAESVAANLGHLEERIRAACDRAGRSRDEIRLVAVTKTRSPADIMAAAASGISDIGENRVQEAAGKKPLVTAPLVWHLVGHLQRNKARKALDIFSVFHSVDSVRIARELQRRCQQTGTEVKVLVEVNTSGEPTKFGVDPELVAPLVEQVLDQSLLELVGLMTIGPGWAVQDPEASRPCFRALARLAQRTRQQFGIPLPQLSMGMSADYEQAIEEGATIVRIGTAIFGPRD